jgi:hypothetical protein
MQLEPLTPTPEQREAILKIAEEPSRAALVGSDLGTGKTLVAVQSALAMGARVTLISAPLHTRYGWQDTVLRQTNYEASFRWVNRSSKDGKAALADLKAGVPGFYFIGRELFRLIDWGRTTVDLIIHDECHTLSNRSNRGFKVASKFKAGYTICQSATWYGSDFSGAWAIGRILWPDLVSRSYWLWVADYCTTIYDHFAPQQKKITGEIVPGAFVSDLPLYINLRNTATQPPMFEDIYVDLTARQRRLYRQMEEAGVAYLKDNPLVADIPIVQRIRLRQITLAECSLVEDRVVFEDDAASSKFDALREFLSDLPDEPVLIATDSAIYARMVARRLGDAAFAWTGDASPVDRDVAKARFMAGDLQYIVATQASISEGVDGLQHNCHILVELSQSDSPLLNQQMIGRLNRKGQKKRVLVYRFKARESIDDEQAETLLQREIAMRSSMVKGVVNA